MVAFVVCVLLLRLRVDCWIGFYGLWLPPGVACLMLRLRVLLL